MMMVCATHPFLQTFLSLNFTEIEPFDEALDRHIWSLSDQRLKWDREIARTRVERPREVEAMLQDLFERQQEAANQDAELTADDLDDLGSPSAFILFAHVATGAEESIVLHELSHIEQVFQKASTMAEELNQARIIASYPDFMLRMSTNSRYQYKWSDPRG